MKTLSAINSVVASVLFAGLTLVVALQVFTRFVLHAPFIWSEEVARFLFFWVVLLGASMSVRRRRHFFLDVTMSRRRESKKGLSAFLLAAVPDLCVLGFSILLLVQGIAYTRIGVLRVATNSRINMALVYLAIPVFAALSIVYSVGNIFADHAASRRGEPPRPGPAAGAE